MPGRALGELLPGVPGLLRGVPGLLRGVPGLLEAGDATRPDGVAGRLRRPSLSIARESAAVHRGAGEWDRSRLASDAWSLCEPSLGGCGEGDLVGSGVVVRLRLLRPCFTSLIRALESAAVHLGDSGRSVGAEPLGEGLGDVLGEGCGELRFGTSTAVVAGGGK